MLVPFVIFNAAGVSACAVMAYGTFVPSSEMWGRIIRRAPAARTGKSIAITFDDGPTAGPTERVLDLLREANVKATFFVVGRNVVRHPHLVRRMHEEGHVIGNHTWDHHHGGWFGSGRYWDEQVRRTGDAVAEIIGVRPALFRPPMGIKTWLTLRAATKEGCQTIGWSHRARDGGRTTTEAILARLADTPAPGDILLLHDGIEPNSPKRNPEPTIAALPELLRRHRERGLELVRVDVLLGVKAYL